MNEIKTAYFNRFTIDLPEEAVLDCSHQGECDDDVDSWMSRLAADLDEIDANDIRAELKEYGAWDAEELADDVQNRKRIIWIAAGNIQDDAEPRGKI